MKRKIKAILLKSGARQGFPIFPHLFKTIPKVLARAIRQQKEINGMQIGKKEVKVMLLADEMIEYISVYKNYNREFLQLINTFSNIAGYKIN